LAVAHLERDSLRVDVIDDGVGFDLRSVPPHRLGLAVSIRGRMAHLPGGSALVQSQPGRGARVVISWSRP
jgi:signal transduction histidine kinase